MLETTIDMRFDAAGDRCVLDSNAVGETMQQAELVAFAHYVARVVSLLGPARAGAVVETLLGNRVSPEPPASGRPVDVRAAVRFVDGASGPRIDFRVSAKRPGPGAASLHVLRDALRARHSPDERFLDRLGAVEEFVGRLAATGQIRRQNEFDLALAAVDVAWRMPEQATSYAAPPESLECPACGNVHRFEPRVWPSDSATLTRCHRCGGGVWKRAGHASRAIRPDIWSGMEAIRAELGGVAAREPARGGGRSLFRELKRVFAENGWPYTQVDGVPVLVAELAGPEGRWDFYAQAAEERGLVLLYSIAPQRIPEERRAEVAQFLTRANYGLADGNFELDFDDGEVRYKTVLHVQGDELDALLVKRVVRANGTALETYLPTIARLSRGAH